jgi:hypothetical protein
MDKKISIIVQAIVAAARRDLRSVSDELETLSKRSQEAATASKPFTTGIEDLDARAAELQRRFGSLRQEAHGLAEEMEQAGPPIDVMGTAVSAATDAVILLGGAFALLKLGQKVFEIAETAAAAERLAEGFDTLATRSQVDSQLLLSSLKEASRGTISEYDLMREANQAWYLGIAKNVGQYADLMKIAEVKSKDLGMSTLQYWQRLTTALESGYPVGMRQLGIVIDNERAYREYAATLGVAADELTDQEQIQARVNAVLADGEPTLRRWEAAEVDAATVTEQFRAATADLTLEIEKKLLPVLIPAVEAITKGLRGIEAGIEGQNAEIARLIEQTGSAAEAEKEFAKNITIASQGMIDGAEAARLAHTAMLDYRLDLIGIDKGIQEDIRAMRMGAQAAADWTGEQDRLGDSLDKAKDIYDKYARDVEEANYRFGRSVADANFRAAQAAEDAAFRRYEIERDAGQRIDDAFRKAEQSKADYIERFQRWHRSELVQHLNELSRLQQDHFDELADMEWDYQEDRRDLLKGAPWYIRYALQREFAERKRIAATGDTQALRDYDRALRERIRAIDPIYAQELDELQEQYDHKRAVEEREAEQARDRTTEDWELRLREQRENLDEQVRQLERNLQEQTRVAERELRDQLEAWRFHDQQRRENEGRAMDNLIADHNRKLRTLYDDTNRRLADLDIIWKHWGWSHGIDYITNLQHALSTYSPPMSPMPAGGWPTLPATPPAFPAHLQAGMWEVPRNMLAMIDKGEMVVPSGPAQRMREGGGAITIEIGQLVLSGAGGPSQARRYARELAGELGPMIQQQSR